MIHRPESYCQFYCYIPVSERGWSHSIFETRSQAQGSGAKSEPSINKSQTNLSMLGSDLAYDSLAGLLTLFILMYQPFYSF